MATLTFALNVEVEDEAAEKLIAAAKQFDREFIGELDEPYDFAKALAICLNQNGFETVREVLGRAGVGPWGGWWIDVNQASRDNES